MIKSSDYSPEHISCPSYVSKAGAELFGVINEAGKVSYLKATIMVDNLSLKKPKQEDRQNQDFVSRGNV